MENVKLFIGAMIIFVAGFAYGNWYAQPTFEQKIMGIHAHMDNSQVQVWWIKQYCSKDNIQKHCAAIVADSVKGE